jgi:hypothetical protein
MYKSEEMRIEILALIRVHGGESAAAKDGGKLLFLLIYLSLFFNIFDKKRSGETHFYIV